MTLSSDRNIIDLRARLLGIAAALGFSSGPALNVPVAADKVWWVYRLGERFATEAVRFAVQIAPTPVLTIGFYASPFTLTELEAKGINGDSVIGYSLYAFEAYVENRPAHHTLGEVIQLGADSERDSVLVSIDEHLRNADDGVWSYLWSMWVRRDM